MRRRYKRKRPLYKRSPPKRRRLSMTNYRRRAKMLASGLPRIVVRRSTRYVTVQVVSSKAGGDMTQASATSRELGGYRWAGGFKNMPAAYLTGFLAGLKAKGKGIERAIPDIGLSPPVPFSRVFAALKGAVDAGLEVPVDEGVYPPEARIVGQHIKDYLEAEQKRVMEEAEGAPRTAAPVADVPSQFEEVKNRIISEVAEAE